MKKAIILAGIACFVFIAAAWSQTEKTVSELTQMTALAKDLDLDVTEWRITMKESIPQDNIYSIIESIEQYANVQKTSEDQADRYFAENVHKRDGASESFVVIVPPVGNAQLIVELRGEKWDEEIEKKYINRKKRLIKTFFTDNVKSFACMQATSDDMINVGEILPKLKLDLDIKHLSEQEENIGTAVNKKVIYGYIPLWQENLIIAGKPMNMQAAITNNKGSGSKFVIGTPILLHEY